MIYLGKRVFTCQVDGERVMTAAGDNCTKVWSATSLTASGAAADTRPQLLRCHDARPAVTAAMAYDPFERLVCSGHRDGAVAAWGC